MFQPSTCVPHPATTLKSRTHLPTLKPNRPCWARYFTTTPASTAWATIYRAGHFFEPFHQRLFTAIENQIRRGLLAEPILLAEQFARDPAFEDLGGVRYLADLVDRAPPAANAPDYARVVYNLALRRDLIRIGGDISTAAQGGDAELTATDQIETG